MFPGFIESWFTVPSGVTVSATNAGGGPTTVSITAGYYSHSTFAAHLAAQLNAQRPAPGGSWDVDYIYDVGTPGCTTIVCYQSSGNWAISWPNTVLRDLLGFDAPIASHASGVDGGPRTGVYNPRGRWIPDCPLALDGDPQMAPVSTDLRLMQTPDGRMFGHKGTSKFVHKNLVYSHVPRARYLESELGIKASWEQFLADTQWGDGHPWFTVASKVQIYAQLGGTVANPLGSDRQVRGWYLQGVEAVKASLSATPWTGLFRLEIPMITASPADVGP